MEEAFAQTPKFTEPLPLVTRSLSPSLVDERFMQLRLLLRYAWLPVRDATYEKPIK